MKKLLYIFLLYSLSSYVFSAELKPFTTDGCSAFPDGTLDQKSLWIECCIRHDLAYWKGGTYDERLAADKSLETCVSKVGEPEIAQLMLAGVRVGGSPYFPTTYRWGYGWPYPRGYKALSRDESLEVQQMLEYFKLLIKSLSEEFKNNIN
jgi:hypothetical protein